VATPDGLHAPGLRFGDRRVMAVMAAVVRFDHLIAGFTNHQLTDLAATLLDDNYTARQATYDLRRLRRTGLIERLSLPTHPARPPCRCAVHQDLRPGPRTRPRPARPSPTRRSRRPQPSRHRLATPPPRPRPLHQLPPRSRVKHDLFVNFASSKWN
jgi:hypothetical protein